MKIINKAIDEDYYHSLNNDASFKAFLTKDQIQAYKEYLKFRANWEAYIEAKKIQKPEYHGPTRTFYSNYHLLPPYKVERDSNNYYSLKKISDDMTVDTSTNFWKFQLYWMRLKTWTINCLVFLAFSVWKGPLGIRCLWGIDDFNYQMNINYQTGEIYYHTRPTLIGSFKKVLEGIKKSRDQFE